MYKIRFGLCLLFSASAFAANFTFYTSQSAFQAAISGLSQQTITFDNLATGPYTTLTTSGVTFVGDNCFVAGCTQVNVFDQATWTLPFFLSSTGNSLASLSTNTVTLPSGVSAVGFLAGASGVVAAPANSTAFLNVPGTTASLSVALDPSHPFPFLGVVSDSPITSLIINSSSFTTIDNLTFAVFPNLLPDFSC